MVFSNEIKRQTWGFGLCVVNVHVHCCIESQYPCDPVNINVFLLLTLSINKDYCGGRGNPRARHLFGVTYFLWNMMALSMGK